MPSHGETASPAPALPITRVARTRVLYAILFIYAATAGTYEIVNSISTIIGDFNLRDQVQAPFGLYGNLIEDSTAAATHAGITKGDTIVTINGLSFTGMALWQRIRWYAHPGDTITLVVRKQNGTTRTAAIPLDGYPKGWSVEDPPVRTTLPDHIFVLAVVLVVPLFCLALGFWVAFARPLDPNAWFVLILLTYPQAFNPGAYRWWIPAWLFLRLYWHLAIYFLATPALFLLGLLFPERSRLDKRLPWLKWLVIALTGASLIAVFVSEYGAWYDLSLLPRVDAIDRFVNPFYVWSSISYIGLYWVLLLDKLRTASSSDARRRLQVLLAGSVVGLGSIVVIWGLFPYFGIADPNNSRWLLFLSIVLMFFFPLTLAYVVIVQRAMDVRLIVRQSLQYTLARRGVIVLQIVLSTILFAALATIVRGRALNYAITILLMGAGVWAIFLLNGVMHRLAGFVDRRFFRETYQADQILGELAEKVRTMVETKPLLETVTQRISDALHVQPVAVLLNGDGPYRPAYALGVDSMSDLVFAGNAGTVQRLKREQQALRVYFDDTNGWLYGPEISADERQKLLALGAELLLPLAVRDELIGFLALGQKRSEVPYSGSDLRLLNSVATQTSLALEVSRLTEAIAAQVAQRERLNRELEIAREVQQKLFPQRLPTVRGLDCCAECRPARQVGGDYYDFLELPGGKLGIAIGDISGKGIGAALMMANLEACLRGQAPSTRNLPELITRVNRMVYEASSANRYATFFYAEYDPQTRHVAYVNAGHNPPFVLRPLNTDCDVFRWEDGGAVIGLLPQAQYEQGCFQLRSGDLIGLYTDGVSESMNAHDQEWGEERLIACAKSCCDLTAQQALDRIMSAALEFAAGAPQHDDMTLMVVRVLA
jgi:sigma-B regulation protein RsbU (phosphoserine phosphatase)